MPPFKKHARRQTSDRIANSDTGYKWWIRYVLVPLVGGGGVVALLVAAYINRPTPREPIKPPVVTSTIPQAAPPRTPPAVTTAPVKPRNIAAEVESLTTRWVAAFFSGNTDEVVALSGMPFFFAKHGLVLTEADLRVRYSAFAERSGEGLKRAAVRAIKVETVRDLQQAGQDIVNQISSVMLLSADDLVVSIKFAVPGRTILDDMRVIVRKVGDEYKIAGVLL